MNSSMWYLYKAMFDGYRVKLTRGTYFWWQGNRQCSAVTTFDYGMYDFVYQHLNHSAIERT